MSKHWKPDKKTVELTPPARPSRIRRDPVRINPNAVALARPQRPANRREREIFLGIAGILIFAVAITAAIIALGIVTVFHDDPAADAQAMQFSQCYNAQGPNCVADGGTIYADGQRIDIAGIEAPKVGDAKCDEEHDRGVTSATLLAEILNSGRVSIGSSFRDQWGRTVSKVQVNGRDVATTMIDHDAAHQAGSGLTFCH